MSRVAPSGDDGTRYCRITHPFHPLCGQRFALVNVRHNWGEDRVDYRDEAGHLATIPAAWTDVPAPDRVVALSAGRLPFRLQDLIELARLVASLRAPNGRTWREEVGHA